MVKYEQEFYDLKRELEKDAFDDAFSAVADKFVTIICYKPADFDVWTALNNMILDYTYSNGIKVYKSGKTCILPQK